jgi:hypothetical protein
VTYPEVVVTIQVDLGAVRDSGANVCPWPNNASCAMDSNLATGREAVVPSIITTDEGGIVSICTDTAASHWVGVSIDSRGRCQ